MEANQFHPHETGDHCHPYMRTSFKTTPAEISDEHCLQKSVPCNACCLPDGRLEAFRECEGDGDRYHEHSSSTPGQKNINDEHLHCVAHSCPLGKIVCCSNCRTDDCGFDKNIIKAEDLYSKRHDYRQTGDQSGEAQEIVTPAERPCCEKKTSWTEPRMCRCDLSDPSSTEKRCECECGATILKPKIAEKKKRK